MMAEHPLGVFALVNPMAERSLQVLTYRPDVGDMGDVEDVGMAIFHFFHRQEMCFETGVGHPRGWRSTRWVFSPFDELVEQGLQELQLRGALSFILGIKYMVHMILLLA